MCELFAVNANRPLEANRYLREFFSHADQHPHGWGIAVQDQPGAHVAELPGVEHEGGITLYKEPVAATRSHLLPQLLEEPISSHDIIAHIRKSTCGQQSRENCHPFVGCDLSGTEWTLAHNGILFNEGLSWSYEEVEAGETDSERALLFFLDVLDEATLRNGGTLDFEARFDALAGAVAQFSNLNRLNLILSDGAYTYVHTNTDRYTLWYRQMEGAVVVSTQPLGGEAERELWKPVPQYRLIAFRDGRIVRTSVPHGYVFCEAILDLRRKFGERWQEVLVA